MNYADARIELHVRGKAGQELDHRLDLRTADELQAAIEITGAWRAGQLVCTSGVVRALAMEWHSLACKMIVGEASHDRG